MGAEAEVLADAEGAVVVLYIFALGAGDVEVVHIGEHRLVRASGAVMQMHLVALADQLPAHFHILGGRAPKCNHRRIVAQELLDGAIQKRGVALQRLVCAMLHQEAHAMGGDRAGGFVAGDDEHQEEVAELLVAQRFILHRAVQQHIDDVLLGVGAMLIRQPLRDEEHFHHGVHPVLLAGGEFRIVHADHDVGQLEQALALVQGHAHQLADGDEGQFRGDVFDELALAAAHRAV